MAPSPREIIAAEYGTSRNIMTPRILGRGWLPGGAYELSRGYAMDDHRYIYGVSVVRLNPDGVTTLRDTANSAMFHSLAAARAHINSLRRAK